jgi:hypothetical protein
MYRASISSPANNPIKCIDFAYEVPFAQTANRRITAHRPDGFEIEAYQTSTRAHTGGCAGRLDTGVTTADNEDIKV